MLCWNADGGQGPWLTHELNRCLYPATGLLGCAQICAPANFKFRQVTDHWIPLREWNSHMSEPHVPYALAPVTQPHPWTLCAIVPTSKLASFTFCKQTFIILTNEGGDSICSTNAFPLCIHISLSLSHHNDTKTSLYPCQWACLNTIMCKASITKPFFSKLFWP